MIQHVEVRQTNLASGLRLRLRSAVAGDEDLRKLTGIHERVQEDAGCRGVESNLRLFDRNEGYTGLLSVGGLEERDQDTDSP